MRTRPAGCLMQEAACVSLLHQPGLWEGQGRDRSQESILPLHQRAPGAFGSCREADVPNAGRAGLSVACMSPESTVFGAQRRAAEGVFLCAVQEL